ncbi:HD domain-containing protein [Noviherbaspirillum saxi]|uniref:HD domain-containing protein n=1 Tax=Noviherbaspirillum saxi TaxID=2320863 RepID=UPI0018F794B1|nr:HD domain-containing protein [Noviherbaspirillum saxi]
MLDTRQDAYRLLQALGAPTRLLVHVQLVGEAADRLVQEYSDLGITFDARLIELGVAVHDTGKIKHPEELDQSGSLHEPAGKIMLLANGVQAEVAQCCVSHAQWQGSEVSFEERSIALADKLWKGKREEALELLVIDDVAARLGVDRWDVFSRLDSVFEEIAAEGGERLERSRRN